MGSAAFSKAVQALDVKTGMLVCLKIIKVCFCNAMSCQMHESPGSCSMMQSVNAEGSGAPLFVHYGGLL